MKQFQHPCIPVIYDIEEEAESLCIIEEYIPGESLFSYCLKQNLQGTEILSFMIQLCDLLEYLHSREQAVLHLDLKPENLKVHEGKLFLLDFGSAVFKSEVGKKEGLSGTPGFCAPECYEGSAAEYSDVYSAGKILDFMLKHGAWQKRKRMSLRQTREQRLRLRLERIVWRATKEKPSERYAEARTMKKALLKCRQDIPELCLPKMLSIAVAGCGRRSGTTYVSLLLAGFLNRTGKRAMYLECNERESIRVLQSSEQSLESKCGRNAGRVSTVWKYRGVRLAESRYLYDLPYCSKMGWQEEEAELQRGGSTAIVRDYGVITAEKLPYLRQADYVLLLADCSAWEKETVARGLGLLEQKDCRRWRLLMNFGSEEDAASLEKSVPELSCYRLPLLFALPDKLPEEWRQVFREIFVKGSETGREE